MGDANEFKKTDNGKPQIHLFPAAAIIGGAKVMTEALKKYEPENWRKCTQPIRYYDAAMRHLLAYQMGEKLDSDSGLPHLDHAIVSLAILRELEYEQD